MDFLYDFLVSLPLWTMFVLTFIATFGVDALYTLWTRRTVSGNAFSAANLSVLIYIFSITAFLGILEVNNLFIFPALVGAWCGSYFTIKLDERKNNMKNTNYMQVVKMTDKEKIKMYMKQRKIKLAEMLVAANNALNALKHTKITH